MTHKLAGGTYRPSNGTEGDYFETGWCKTCKYLRIDSEGFSDCSQNILTATMLFDIGDKGYPSEWVYDKDGLPSCSAWMRAGTVDDVDLERRKAARIRRVKKKNKEFEELGQLSFGLEPPVRSVIDDH